MSDRTTEFDELVFELTASGIPFAEDGWDEKPMPPYGVYAIDGSASTVWAGDQLVERAYQGTVDLFTKGRGRAAKAKVERALRASGVAWRFNSQQYEEGTRLMHFEWVFEVDDED